MWYRHTGGPRTGVTTTSPLGWNLILHSVFRATGFDSEDRGEFCIYFYSRPQHTNHVARFVVVFAVFIPSGWLSVTGWYSPCWNWPWSSSWLVPSRQSQSWFSRFQQMSPHGPPSLALSHSAFWLNYGNSPSNLLDLELILSTLRWFNLQKQYIT